MEKKLVLISGVSGGGKTACSNILEDMGYRCIDQYPVELLPGLFDLIENDPSPTYQKVALTIPLTELEKFSPLVNNINNIKPLLVLIDCSKEEILKRYKFTRRVHPLLISNVANSLEEAVDVEKAIIEKFKKNKVSVIDTTTLTLKGHREKITKILNQKESSDVSLSFVSFGYKNGIASDADLVFDVRFLKNPFYDPKLRKKTGNTKAVKEYVMSDSRTLTYLKKLTSFIDFYVKSYDQGEKRHLTIAVGCTGGQHRSVVITNYLFEHYKDKFTCYKKHREVGDKK